jgi:bifunctional NMN adenylyltransferase/nudix hydrolase
LTTAVVIGRFQPFHNGHLGLLRRAADFGERVVVVLGSAGASSSPRNPFSAAEREEMIRRGVPSQLEARLSFVRQRDLWDSARWAAAVRVQVERQHPGPVSLVGYHKDSSSAYLDLFPGWTPVEAGRQGSWDATPLRERILSRDPWSAVRADLSGNLPDPVLAWLDSWAGGERRAILAEDARCIAEYRAKWGEGPFLTVDALVRCAGRILVIERGNRPGRGLLALPGGFLEPSEPLEAGARRELQEETGLSVDGIHPAESRWFDHPGRSLRARILTCAFRYDLPGDALPAVSGGDDAGGARWMDLAEIRSCEDRFFEDHFHILTTLSGIELPN